jgi:hypothetical protein
MRLLGSGAGGQVSGVSVRVSGQREVSGVSVRVSGRINWSSGVLEWWSAGRQKVLGFRFPRLRFASDGIVDRCREKWKALTPYMKLHKPQVIFVKFHAVAK